MSEFCSHCMHAPCQCKTFESAATESMREMLLLNTLTFVKEIALNAQHGLGRPEAALANIVQEIERTREAYDMGTANLEAALAAPSFNAAGNGNSVELRTVGKHKWLFINGVHIAQVMESALTFSTDNINTFTVKFATSNIKGFDTE